MKNGKKSKSIKKALMVYTGAGILIPVAILVIGILISLSMISQQSQKVTSDQLYNSIKESIKDETEIVNSNAEALYAANKGSLSESDLENMILDSIRNTKYGSSGYFFVYREDGTRLVAPENRAQEGQNLIDTVDKNGVRLVADLIDLAKKGGGFLTYVWLNPDTNQQEDKLAYAIPLKLGNTELMLGTGTYVPMIRETQTQLDETIRQTEFKAVFILVPVCILFTLLALIFLYTYYNRKIFRPISGLSATADRLADGDVNVSVENIPDDEIGSLMNSFNVMSENIREQSLEADSIAKGDLTTKIRIRSEGDTLGSALSRLVETFHHIARTIITAAEQVSSGSALVSELSTSLSQRTTEQASSVQELSASMEEMSSETELNAQNAGQASQLVDDAKKNALAGAERMKGMLGAMEEINLAAANIGNVIKVIDDIAFQTNILALNAAVEAARAGQYGRSFAVVADEVRALANRSADAVKETSDIINGTSEKIASGTKIAGETAEALRAIVKEVEAAADLVDSIAVASKEQAAGIGQINQGIIQVSQVVQANVATSEESAATSQELSAQATQLREALSVFKLNES